MYDVDKVTGETVRQMRGSLGLTQTELAEKSGLSLGAIQLIEGGKRKPRASTVLSILRVLQPSPPPPPPLPTPSIDFLALQKVLTQINANLLALLNATLKFYEPKLRTKRTKTEFKGESLPEIAKVWNEWADEKLQRVISVEDTGTRYKNLKTRWITHPIESYWISVIRRLNQSEFCLGNNDRKWQASIDWLIKPDTSVRILEGKYDNKKEIKAGPQIVGYITNAEGKTEPVYK